MNEEAPIATYREKRFDGKRVFELFQDRIRIRGSVQLSSDFETTIPLSTLSPSPTRTRMRNKGFWSGLRLFNIGGLVGLVLHTGFHMSLSSQPVVLLGVLALSGILLMLATVRKVEFVGFTTIAGVRILDLARSGPDKDKLDSFLELLTAAISKAAKG